jgi:hypothetical protein
MWSVLSPVPVRKGQNGLWTGLKDFSRLSAALIAKAVYKGIVRGFDFTSYVMIHQQAHQDLTRLGRPVPEGKKIRDFLNGITDPQFTSIKLNVLANPVFMNDISLAINYIASAIDLTIKNANQSNQQISDMPRGRGHFNRGGRGNGGQGRSNQGRGENQRGHGRGRSRGRGGRYVSWYNNDNSNQNENQSLSRSYTREEWTNVACVERNRVYRARVCLETARTVAAILREQNDAQTVDVSAITNTVQNQRVQDNATQATRQTATAAQISVDNASQAMSRRRHVSQNYSSQCNP